MTERASIRAKTPMATVYETCGSVRRGWEESFISPARKARAPAFGSLSRSHQTVPFGPLERGPWAVLLLVARCDDSAYAQYTAPHHARRRSRGRPRRGEVVD